MAEVFGVGRKNREGGANNNLVSSLIPARVISIDQSNTLSNGNITVEPMTISQNQPGSLGISATPLFPNIKNYPLVNETVYLLSFPTGEYSNNPGKVKYYYLSPVNIWNNPQVNPTPNQSESTQGGNQNKNLNEIEAGSPNISTTQQTTKFKPGTYFKEKSNIFPLYPFEGDVIVEGRFGNSLRFGSTDIIYQETTSKELITKKLEESYTYPLGEITPRLDFSSKLIGLNNQVTSFASKYPDYAISISIESSESQVTNPNGIERGELAKQRAEKLKIQLESYSNLKFNITTNSIIGDIKYTPGIDNPSDPKYLQDQYSTIKISLQGVEVTQNPSGPQPLNNWSNVPENGDPITILRNGQSSLLDGPAQSNTIEDINNDISSIWLTSTQQIPLTASSDNAYLSYPNSENTPEAVNEYQGSQIILNSNRLVFNTKEDHIMLSSAKSINLNAQQSINFDTTGDTIFQSNKVYLGGTKNSQPVILGDEMVNLLTDVLSDLNFLCGQISNQLGVPTGAPLEPLASSARIVKSKIGGYKTRLKNSLSSTTKTV